MEVRPSSHQPDAHEVSSGLVQEHDLIRSEGLSRQKGSRKAAFFV